VHRKKELVSEIQFVAPSFVIGERSAWILVLDNDAVFAGVQGFDDVDAGAGGVGLLGDAGVLVRHRD
jgi:hypothetical protein